MHVIAAKAVCLYEALQPEFKVYQEAIVKNASALCRGLMNRGINIVSGGTDNHMMLVDLRGTGLTGKELETRLDDAHITCNKNAVPNDPENVFVTSGIRLGTPAVTSRGMNTEDMDRVAEAIHLMMEDCENKDNVLSTVNELTTKYPLVRTGLVFG